MHLSFEPITVKVLPVKKVCMKKNCVVIKDFIFHMYYVNNMDLPMYFKSRLTIGSRFN